MLKKVCYKMLTLLLSCALLATALTAIPAPALAAGGGVADVAAGGEHSLAIKNDGTLWAWGDNSYGQLGDVTRVDKHSPIQIMTDVKAVAAGDHHSLAIKDDCTLWSWGFNYDGQLGDGTTRNKTEPAQIMSDVKAVAAGGQNWSFNHSLALKNDGTLWAWGSNGRGQLGDGTYSQKYRPVQIMTDVKDIAAGLDHSLAIKNNGTLWAWGDNSSGQLGNGTTSGRNKPVQIMTDVKDVAARFGCSLAIKNDGTLWAWGNNNSGQLGDGTNVAKYSPVKIMTDVKDVAAGDSHSLAIKNNGTLWVWGYNDNGQLGDGTNQNKSKPVQIILGGSSPDDPSNTPTSITVSPKNLSLAAGKTKQLKATIKPKKADKSVTWTSDNDEVAAVDDSGKVTAKKAGVATITCAASSGGITGTCIVEVSPVVDGNTQYRAMLISNGDYLIGKDLEGAINSKKAISNMLYYYNNKGKKYSIYEYTNLTGKEIENVLANMSIKWPDGSVIQDNDVTVFYYAGHGGEGSDDEQYRGALMGVDDYAVTADVLSDLLGRIPGTVVVILDCCHSGWHISGSAKSKGNADRGKQFNDAIIRAFTQANAKYNSKRLTDSPSRTKFKILTSCGPNEGGWDAFAIEPLTNIKMFYLSFYMCVGGGYHPQTLFSGLLPASLKADKNNDKIVTLKEMHAFVNPKVLKASLKRPGTAQNTQIWPRGDSFPLIIRKK